MFTCHCNNDVCEHMNMSVLQEGLKEKGSLSSQIAQDY
jgi:hypothetical protein